MKNAPNFELIEFTRSKTAEQRGLDNTPLPQALENIETILAPGMQRVRDLLGCPVIVATGNGSGYRSPTVNRAVGGSETSQHMQGLAADFVAPKFGTPLAVARYIARHADMIGFDQLIAEGNWTHVSFSRKPRGEVLTAHFDAGGTRYTKGLA